MATLDELLKEQKEATKILQEIAKSLGRGGPGHAQSGGGGGGGGGQGTLGNAIRQVAAKRGASPNAQRMMQGGQSVGAGGMSASSGMAGGVGAVIEIYKQLAQLPGRVKEFVDSLHEANRGLSQFSPSMMAVMMKADLSDMMRSARMGEARAESAGQLADARDRLGSAMEGPQNAWANLQNKAGAVAANLVSGFLEKSEWGQQLGKILDEVGDALDDLNKHLEDSSKRDNEQYITAGEWFDEVAKDAERRQLRRQTPIRPGQGGDPRPKFKGRPND